MSVRRVISGGQVGADHAGLRAAKRLGLETGGYMPHGWKTIAGPRPEYADLYGMDECPDGGYPTRTLQNILASDATVAFAYDFTSPGEVLTRRLCREGGRPYFAVRLRLPPTDNLDGWATELEPRHLRAWLERNHVATLNVAGNADSRIEQAVEDFLAEALR